MQFTQQAGLEVIRQLLTLATITVVLAACDGSNKVVNNLTSLLGAAGEHPCSDDLDYQRQINGEPDDARVRPAMADGTFIEHHWYAESAMIVFYAYQENNNWCEVWTESGVEW